jgi:protein-tyrosine kinase
MSIVEKALEKQKLRAPAGEPPAVEQVTLRAVPQPFVIEAKVPDDSRRTDARVTVDLERLRARHMLPRGDEAHRVAEEIRRIKWPLLTAAFGTTERVKDGNLLLITSAVPGEGKTFVSTNLALSIAQERNAGVLLVDADFARAGTTAAFDLQERKGFAELLEGTLQSPAQAIVATDVGGLRILPAGHTKVSTPELFASRRMGEILDWLRVNYADSVIVFDSPPLLSTNDAQVLAAMVGQVYLVIRADHTPQPVVLDALQLLKDRAAVFGILNQLETGGLGKYYGYGYGEHASKNKQPSGS